MRGRGRARSCERGASGTSTSGHGPDVTRTIDHGSRGIPPEGPHRSCHWATHRTAERPGRPAQTLKKHIKPVACRWLASGLSCPRPHRPNGCLSRPAPAGRRAATGPRRPTTGRPPAPLARDAGGFRPPSMAAMIRPSFSGHGAVDRPTGCPNVPKAHLRATGRRRRAPRKRRDRPRELTISSIGSPRLLREQARKRGPSEAGAGSLRPRCRPT